MVDWTEYSRFLIALLVILDPFFVVPIFLSITHGFSARRRNHVVTLTALSVFMVLTVAALTGETLLHWLGASLGSFRVGGGIVLFLMALAMLKAQPDAVRATQSESNPVDPGASIAIVPLAIPLLAGPGAISTVIIEMHRSTVSWHFFAVIASIFLVCCLLWIVLRLAVPIGNLLGEIGINVINRIFGLILAAISVEIIANGLKELFPILRNP